MTAQILDALFGAMRPKAPILPADFAEQTLVLPAATNARGGPLRLTKYQRDALNMIAEPGVHTLVLRWAAQTGKSTVVNSAIAYFVAQEPSPILVVQPTDAKARSWSQERFGPLVEASPALRELIVDSEGANSATLKQFPGGFLATGSSYQANSLAARSIRVLLADETDRWALSAGKEGAPLALARKRQATFRDRLAIIASTPVLKATSVISAEFDKGDQRQWIAACEACGVFNSFHSERLVFPAGKPGEARLVCTHCGHRADEAERLRMTQSGHWQATAQGQEGVISLQLSELASEFSSLKQVATQVDNAVTHAQKIVVLNTVWGLPADVIAETEVVASELQARAVTIETPYPADIQFVTAGVDVQADRLEMTILAHAKNRVRYVFDHVAFNGDTTTETPWQALDRALGATFKLADKRELPFSAIAIDSGYATTRVCEFVVTQRQKQRRVHAIKGVTGGWDRPLLRGGSKIKGLTRVMLISVDPAKAALQRALNQKEPNEPNFIELPAHLASNYFDQLSAERLTVTYKRGYAIHRFEKEPHARNEGLDCLVYADAIAGLVKRPAPPANAPAKPKASIAERAAALQQISNPTMKGNHQWHA